MAEVPFEPAHTPQDHLHSPTAASRKKLPTQPQRQLLSCTKCRERKVKCDRTKPCSACCVRGLPRECHFIAEDGNYTPIQQTYELRRLRAENLQLKQRFRALGIPLHDEEPDASAPLDPPTESTLHPARKRRASKQPRFHESAWQDSIYFGAPGLATVISDFASVNINKPETLTHILPRSIDLFTSDISPAYAFATLFSASPDECIPQLLSCLPAKPDLGDYLHAFGHRVSMDMAAEVATSEVERFLSDAKTNSQSCPSMLALLFAIVALGAQHLVWSKRLGRDAEKMEAEAQKGNVYIAAAMQALRLDSFLHKPSLMALQTLLLMGKYLADSGRFLDAFALFGTTIRLAHSIGLHCHPKYLASPAPPQTQIGTRQKIWWHMLRVDEEYSMTFGRPLGISSIGTCCPPQELTTDPVVVRLRDFMVKFTLLARQILTSNRLTDFRIDEFTDALRALMDTVPETLQFSSSWKDPENTSSHDLWPLRAMAAVYHCKAHTYLVLLNRQRTEDEATPDSNSSRDKMPSSQAANRSSSSASPPTRSPESSTRGRAAVIDSSKHILSAFEFFHHRNPSALIDWSLGQQAFNSSMLLLLDAIEHQRITSGALQAEQSLHIFQHLEQNNVHKLARYAVEKISRALQTLRSAVGTSTPHDPPPPARHNGAPAAAESVMGHTGMQLLQDCSAHAAAHEAFAPITWGTPGLSVAPASEQGARPTGAVNGLHTPVTRYAGPLDDDGVQMRSYTGLARLGAEPGYRGCEGACCDGVRRPGGIGDRVRDLSGDGVLGAF